MFKKLMLIVLLGVNFSSHATTDQKINVESLMLQKSYLKEINQCGNEKSFLSLIKSAVKEANTFYEHGSYAQTIEEVILQNPACFIASTNKLKKNVKRLMRNTSRSPSSTLAPCSPTRLAE